MTGRMLSAVSAQGLGWWLGGPMIGPICRLGGAVVVSVGPWLVSVLALAIVSITMTPVMGDRAVEDTRLSVVYAFAIAPLIAGPVGAIAARLIREAIEEHGGCEVFDIFRTAALSSGALAMVVATMVALVLHIHPVGVALGFIWTTAAAALLWVSFAVLGAIRAYRFLIGSFATGMLFALACSLAAARQAPTVELLVWSFNAGIAFCVALSFRQVAAWFWLEDDDPGLAFRLLLAGIERDWPVALGIAAAVAAIWADKVVFWFGPEGLRSSAGFAHYAPYDSVMFVAHLSLMPCLAAMLIFQNGILPEVIGAFRRSLAARSTYDEIASATDMIATTVWGNILTIIFIQATCSLVLILMAPLVASMMDFDLMQFALLRLGVVAVFLQSLLFLSCSVFIICNQLLTFCLVQLLFLFSNVAASVFLMQLMGINSYALFASSMAAAIIAFIGAYFALSRYDYLVFVGTNPTLHRRQGRNECAVATPAGALAHIRSAHGEWKNRARRIDAQEDYPFNTSNEVSP